MLPAYDFNLALTRVIEPTRGPRAELATLQDAARFIGQMKPWRQVRASNKVLVVITGGDVSINIVGAIVQRLVADHFTFHLT
jgi:hypothetical protein